MVNQGSSCFLPVSPPVQHVTSTIATKERPSRRAILGFLKARLGCDFFISTLVPLIKIQSFSPNPAAEEIRKNSLPECLRIREGNRIGENVALSLSQPLIKLQIKLLNRYLGSTVFAIYVGHHKQNKLFLKEPTISSKDKIQPQNMK